MSLAWVGQLGHHGPVIEIIVDTSLCFYDSIVGSIVACHCVFAVVQVAAAEKKIPSLLLSLTEAFFLPERSW